MKRMIFLFAILLIVSAGWGHAPPGNNYNNLDVQIVTLDVNNLETVAIPATQQNQIWLGQNTTLHSVSEVTVVYSLQVSNNDIIKPANLIQYESSEPFHYRQICLIGNTAEYT